MGTYFFNYVRTRDGIPNREGLAQVKRTVEAYGGRWHSHREDQGLEDAAANSVVLVEFESMTQAESCYNSSEYKNVLDLYVENAIDLVLADGVSPDFTMAGFRQGAAMVDDVPKRCAGPRATRTHSDGGYSTDDRSWNRRMQ